MLGFDWNGNGKSDTFDHFMDMKVTSSSTNDNLDVRKTSTNEAKETQAKQDDNATTTAKSVLCVAVCLIAFAICLSGGVSKLGMALIMIGAAVLGYFIMNK